MMPETSHAVPSFEMPDLEVVRRMEERLNSGLAPVWVASGGETVTVADGRVFMWFATRQKAAEILRREFLTCPETNEVGALHFKILEEIPYKLVKALVPHSDIRRGGFWYAVHGD